MTAFGKSIYTLIPAIYRQRDAALGRPLQALCKVLDLEYQSLQSDIASLYEQWFIETCSQWVVPYIGELVGVTGIDTAVANVATQRTRVANTLGYRSRRGTSAVLASACADASGWPALPVEYFLRVITSVNVGAVELLGRRADNLRDATIDISRPASLAYLDGPFSNVARTVSVTAIDQPKVHISGSTVEDYNLPNIGLFLWRVAPMPVTGADPATVRAAEPEKEYQTFQPLGVDTPLLQLPVDRTSPWTAPGPENMPLSISRLMLAAWTQMWRDASPNATALASVLPPLGFSIFIGGTPIPPGNIYVPTRTGNVTSNVTEELGLAEPNGYYAMVDPERGRFKIHRLLSELKSTVTVDWTWGQPGLIGGGPYDRTASMIQHESGMFIVLVSRTGVLPVGTAPASSPPIYPGIEEAFAGLCQSFQTSSDLGKKFDVLIRILDSATYPSATIELPDQARLTIQALDGERPTVQAGKKDRVSLRVKTATADGRARLMLSGLLLESTLDLQGELEVHLIDTTVEPSRAPVLIPAVRWSHAFPSTVSEPAVSILRCITGPIELQQNIRATLTETIVDGRGGKAIKGPGEELGPLLTLDAVSVLGDVEAMSLDGAQDVIITGHVRTQRVSRDVLQNKLIGLTLVSNPSGSPGKAEVTWSRPSSLPPGPFTSTRYGDPGYGQLRLDTEKRLLRGGSGGGEMGAYHSLASGQRLANLQPMLTEYAPFGFDVGIFIMGQTVMPSTTTVTASSSAAALLEADHP